MQPHRYLLRARPGVTPSTGTNQSQISHHRFCQLSVESSDGSFATGIFPMVRTDTSSTLSAFATQYPGPLSLGTCSAFCTGHFFQPKASSLQSSAASFVIFSTHVKRLLITLGSGTRRNRSCMPGPLTSAFVQLPNCTLDLPDKQYTGENLPGDES